MAEIPQKLRKSKRTNAGINRNLDNDFNWPSNFGEKKSAKMTTRLTRSDTNLNFETSTKKLMNLTKENKENGPFYDKPDDKGMTERQYSVKGSVVSGKTSLRSNNSLYLQKKRNNLEAEKLRQAIELQKLEAKLKILELENELKEEEMEEDIGENTSKASSLVQDWIYNNTDTIPRENKNNERKRKDEHEKPIELQTLCKTVTEAIQSV